VFLLALLLQLAFMHRNKEILALEASSISLKELLIFFLAYALIWSFCQLFFAEGLGVKGLRYTNIIWKEKVRKKQIAKKRLDNLWFKDGAYFIYARNIWPAQGRGEQIKIYEVDPGKNKLKSIIRARTFLAQDGHWELKDVELINPETFSREKRKQLQLVIHVDIEAFLATGAGLPPESLSLWELKALINKLRQSGSNVEGLQTTLYSKLSYAFSIFVMTILALVLSIFIKNIYLLIFSGLIITFFYYAIFILGVSLGEKGILPPFAGAWLGNIVFIIIGSLNIAWQRHRF
jgi:lipopolysaccharide export system permease protein